MKNKPDETTYVVLLNSEYHVLRSVHLDHTKMVRINLLRRTCQRLLGRYFHESTPAQIESWGGERVRINVPIQTATVHDYVSRRSNSLYTLLAVISEHVNDWRWPQRVGERKDVFTNLGLLEDAHIPAYKWPSDALNVQPHVCTTHTQYEKLIELSNLFGERAPENIYATSLMVDDLLRRNPLLARHVEHEDSLMTIATVLRNHYSHQWREKCQKQEKKYLEQYSTQAQLKLFGRELK